MYWQTSRECLTLVKLVLIQIFSNFIGFNDFF